MPIGELRKDQRFGGPDAPALPLPTTVKRAGAAAVAAYRAEHRRRWTVVAVCEDCGRELVAEEVTAHAHSHLGSKARVLARMYDDLPPAARAELRAYIERVEKAG